MKRGLTLLGGLACLLSLSSCHLFWDVLSSSQSGDGSASSLETSSHSSESGSDGVSLSSPVLDYGPLDISLS